MECTNKKCNYIGEMIIKEAGPHIGHYCPKCDKWQGKWLKKTKSTIEEYNQQTKKKWRNVKCLR